MRHIITLLLILALVACSGSSADETSDAEGEPKIQPVDVPVLTGGPSGMEALGSFTLRYDAELNCLYYDEDDNNGEPGTGGRNVVQWLNGTTASRVGDIVTVYAADGTELAVTGELTTVTGGGTPFLGSDHCNAIGIWMIGG